MRFAGLILVEVFLSFSVPLWYLLKANMAEQDFPVFNLFSVSSVFIFYCTFVTIYGQANLIFRVVPNFTDKTQLLAWSGKGWTSLSHGHKIIRAFLDIIYKNRKECKWKKL